MPYAAAEGGVWVHCRRTSLPVCKSMPRYTLPKLPCPISLPCTRTDTQQHGAGSITHEHVGRQVHVCYRAWPC